jgi:hypothetical protein
MNTLCERNKDFNVTALGTYTVCSESRLTGEKMTKETRVKNLFKSRGSVLQQSVDMSAILFNSL